MQRRPTRSVHGEALEPRLLLSSGYALTADTSFIPAPDGFDPTALIIDRNGNLFGATQQGGTWNDGTVFEIPSGTTTIKTLASLDESTTGSDPTSIALDANGDLFGTTRQFEGTPTYGTLFEISAGSNTAALVAKLSPGDGGYEPIGSLIYYNGNLYGAGTDEAVFNGGTMMSTEGVVFEVNPTTGTFTNLAAFSSASGIDPYGGLVLGPDGNLIGETSTNFSGPAATVFEVSTSTGALTTLATFETEEQPVSNLAVDASGDVFGATQASPALPARIFEIAPGTHTIGTVANTEVNGASDNAGSLALDAAGDLYGGRAGSFFEVPRGTNTITTVVNLDAAFGALGGPYLGPLLGPDGDIFGATLYDGTDHAGNVFRAAGNTIVTIANFTNPGASQPGGPLLSDPDGNLFGTTSGGGVNHDGTIFEIPRGSDAISVIASFDGTNGENPSGSLAMDSGGDLFGTAGETVFELPHNSTRITAIASVPRLQSGLVINGDGDLFGVIGESTTRTRSGKTVPISPASVFKISHATGALSTIVQFGRGVQAGGISLDSAGDIFGTFSYPAGNGTIYDIPQGTRMIDPLANLPENVGGPLAIDSAGDLFGTITGPLGDDPGIAFMSADTVFELAHGARQIKPIGYLRDYNGYQTMDPLVVDANGYVFGATPEANFPGGSRGPGTVFEIAKGSGAWTTLAKFSGTNGIDPLGITLDPDGNIVGTTSSGGTSNAGAFFKLSPTDVPPSGAAQLVISSMPSAPIAGVPFDPPVSFSIVDDAGQVVTTDNSTVTLSWGLYPNKTSLTATAVNGIATFSNVVINQSGPVSLEATDGTLGAEDYLIMAQPFPLVPRLGNDRFPSGMLAGTNVNLTVPLAISNRGKAFSGTVQIDLCANAAAALDGNEVLLQSYSIPISLPARGTTSLSLPIHSLPPELPAGTYHLLAKFGGEDVVSFAASTQTVTLGEPLIQPALSVGAASPATLAAGQFASVSVTVTNNGNVTADSVDLTLNPSSDGITPIPGMIMDHIESHARIAPHHSKRFRLRFKVPTGLSAGDYVPYISSLLAGVTQDAAGATPFRVVAGAGPAA